MRNSGVREISRRTGYSPATVSNALSNKRSVSKATTERILAVAKELGYRRRGKIDNVTFVLARKSGEVLDEGTFHPGVVEGVEKSASAAGLTMSYVTLDLMDANAKRQAADLINDPSSAVVLLGTEMAGDDFRMFENPESPLVVVDGWSDHIFFDCVLTSNESSAFRATTYLIDHGHRDIGYIFGSCRIKNFPLRERGYRRALRERGLSINENFMVEVGTTVGTAYEAMRSWLATKPLLPTAFFAENDIMALGAMRAMAEAGISIPQDVSVVGFDDLPFATIAMPPLTTMRIPNREMGSLAVDLLVEQVNEPRYYHKNIHLSTKMVERDSVASI
ncbi:MAG: LacI family DNA-binding transcriptional regulator [Atopobiaceae bacterium]|jgi:LacI family purine nucleotide synthesis repressor